MKDGKLKVVVYAITKNEEKFVDRWVDSMSEADAIVVLDTGSDDGTVGRLRGRGCTVGEAAFAPWRTLGEYDDAIREGKTPWRFDVARNKSIDLAVETEPDADILVCTDLDEILVPGWREKLERAWVAALDRGESPTTATYEYVWNFNDDGSDATKFTYEKVHVPNAGIRWLHPVHEILAYDGIEKRSVDVPGMRLEHHADPTKSRGFYLNILELSVREDPDDDRNMHYLGREYMFNGKWYQAICTLKKHLSLPRATWNAERAASMRFIARCHGELGHDDARELWLLRAIDEAPNQREAALELAEFYHDRRDWTHLVATCKRCVAVRTRVMSYLTRSEAWGARPWDLLCIGLWWTGHREEAVVANEMAIRLDPNDGRLLDNRKVMNDALGRG